ncbi:hypothetical protein L228DRAFT_26043 [Xylona heveae TC161]|uniref:Ubiquitin-like protease family profile domain-containing protein n=1 Tax=Xylona heveae (strain CBS 132557 / TC161) TaxID=1328760 RepID=A0A165AE76_XYLHT|nr:hypothetical protein L228DRAFT_26043 [Xylona heveae TC161]KZF20331.1 hypothetical protein L228DRAFT_26043 [Xylona heveae TC161]
MYLNFSPRIVTLDSLNLPHNPTIRNLQRYLAEEGKHKRQLEVEVNQGTKAKGIPTQNNWCDCGLFLLGYITKFLQEPRQFINKIINEEYKRHDQHEHWPEMNALRMRLQILELIIRLHKEQRDAQRGIAKANKTDRGGAAAKAFTSSKSPSAEASARQGLSSEDQSEDDDVSIATAAYHGDLRLDNPAVSKPSPSASGSGPDEPQSPGFEGDTQDSLIITRVGPAKSSPSTGDTNKRLESPRSTRVEVARTPSPARSVGSPMLRSSPRAKKQGQRMRVVIPSSQGSEH